MRFEHITPCERLKPFVKHLVISETEEAQTYKVFPSTALVLGFQYRGSLAVWQDNNSNQLSGAGITGLVDSFRVFENSADIGTILVFFTETGISHFTDTPAHELFNQSIALEPVFDRDRIRQAEEKLSIAATDRQRIRIVEQFLLSQLKEQSKDLLIAEAVRLIYATHGAVRIQELSRKLFLSQSSFEKRFRKSVGTSPKKFASIVRFNALLGKLGSGKSLTDLCYEYNFFDQAHFIKDFKQYTGETPEAFRKLF